jgi:hypothetical protein
LTDLQALPCEVWLALKIVTMNGQENFQIPAELEIPSLPAPALSRGGQCERFIGGLGKKPESLR